MVRRGETQRIRLEITGQVQGVGFRPYVFQLANELRLAGWVLNDPAGVTLEVQGERGDIENFVKRLPQELPPLAEIATCRRDSIGVAPEEKNFRIRLSEGGELLDAQVTVDTATCDECLREMNDPDDPRYRYPFINCTNCGPRYSIVRRIPYDRPNTTMSEFGMCPLCLSEYSDPASRRFHAQPIACPRCGPNVWLVDTRGSQIECDDPIREAAERIRSGEIVAIKGLGGFHLACRADSHSAVWRLRERKRRDAKPFALMGRNLDQIRSLCDVTPAAESILTSPLRPIVILSARSDAQIAAGVADGYGTIGIMLPYTPLHELLFSHGLGPLVMTSGNYSEEPLVKDNESAISHLSGIADALLLHNRRIERRIDDSVIRVGRTGRVQVFRRARGYAPRPIPLTPARSEPEWAHPAILAVGGELKNTVCFARDGRALLSEHIGDLKDGRVYRAFIDTINHLEQLFEVDPELIVADLHPGYLSTHYALKRHRGEMPARRALPILRVQHHHAHVAACLVDNANAGPVIGVVCDGTGYGDDGAVWGCEILRTDMTGYTRVGHLRYIPLVGGDIAAVETYRPALAALFDAFGDNHRRIIRDLSLSGPRDRIRGVLEILSAGIETPQGGSLGRWFDAVAYMCGIATENRCEGEAPMKLEAVIRDGVRDAYSFAIRSEGPFLIDLRPMVEGIAFDLIEGLPAAEVSAKFHNTVIRFLAAGVRRAAAETGINVAALTGGCFANQYLMDGLTEELSSQGMEVLTHRELPCNDGAIAVGQAAVALARTAREYETRKANVEDIPES